MSSKLKTILIDDERLARVNLRNMLCVFEEIEIIEEADSYQNAIEIINLKNPDLVFLDIQLGQETGFEILDKLTCNPRVIFVTAYDDYALRAFEVNAIDYLMKPVSHARLTKAVKRVISGYTPSNNMSGSLKYDDMIYARLNHEVSRFLKVFSIVTISSIGNYTQLLTSDGKKYTLLKTLKEWEENLPKDHFIRVHRSKIVNLDFIDNIEKSPFGKTQLYLRNFESTVEVSRRYAARLKGYNKKRR